MALGRQTELDELPMLWDIYIDYTNQLARARAATEALESREMPLEKTNRFFTVWNGTMINVPGFNMLLT